MILDETRMASTVLDGEEETTPETEAPSAILDGEEGTPVEGGDAPVAMLDGEEEGGAPAMPSEEGAGEGTETPAPDHDAGM